MNLLVSLARKTVEDYVKKGKIIDVPEKFPEEFLNKRAGVFITVQKEKELRACIGTYLPTKINIAEEIIHNAVAAASEDYRFGPIEEKELDSLSYTVCILSFPEPVKDIKELDPKKFGIIVKTGPFTYPNQKNVVFDGTIPYKTGLLLPDLEGIDTAEKQLAVACQKGGINPEKEKVFIYKFTVEKHQ